MISHPFFCVREDDVASQEVQKVHEYDVASQEVRNITFACM
jgi:hypothetical protein